MKYSAISLLVLVFSLIFSSCKNDLEVLAPGKESVSVYAIISPTQRTQNVRINKVYLTDGDAVAAGQDASTINYGPNELRVTLQRFVGGSTTPTLTTVGNGSRKEIVLTETVVTTAPGAFNSSQRLWQTTDKLFGSGDYKLTITNNSTGTTYTSQTTVIDSVKPFGTQQPMPFLYIPAQPTSQPMHGNYPAIPISTDKPKYVNYDILTQTYQIKFRSIPNARLYGVVMRFHYIDSLVGGGTNQDFVDYTFTNAKSDKLDGGLFVEDGSGISYFKFTGDEFYKNLGNEMAKKSSANVIKRRSYYMEYIVTAGSENLSEFLQINAPSTTIAQDKPLYTNISGGVGVFSSRSTSVVTKDLWSDFIDKIACHPSTNPYRFCNFSGQVSTTVCN
jgi:hypothetical protein